MLLFLEVYECNSVSRAAERLGLTQSTVSHGLDRLRRALNDPLFVRDGRSIAPTSRADFIAPQIRDCLNALETLAEPQTYDPAADSQVLTVAAHWDELQTELGLIQDMLRRRAPNMPLRALALGPADNTRALLEAGDADLVIVVRANTQTTDLEFQPLLRDHKVIFYDANHVSPPTDMDAYLKANHAVLDFGGKRQSLLQMRLGELNADRRIGAYASDLNSLATLMRGSDMIATMQNRFADSVFSGLQRAELPFPLQHVQYDMYWHKRQALSHRLIWIRSQITNVVQRHWLPLPVDAEAHSFGG